MSNSAPNLSSRPNLAPQVSDTDLGSENSNSRLKTELRQAFKRTLIAYNSGPSASRAAGHLCFNLESFFSKMGGRGSVEGSGPGSGPGSVRETWAAFQPVGFECNVRAAIARLDSIDWVYPRVEGESLRFYRSSAFIENRWGILEPDPARSTPVELGTLQGLIIPALAFDSKCNRLGRGGGYYDRALAELKLINPNACKIGVALDIQISAEVFPTESFDIPMDWVVTESRSFERTK